MLTAEVCEWVVGPHALPGEAVAVLKRHVLDTVGVMLAGSVSRPAEIARAVFPDRRALLLGLYGHIDDYDDTQLATRPESVYGLLTHPSVPALAALLAVGARCPCSGADFLTAFACATEAECRLADAIDPRHYREGFHSSGTLGTLAAALAACQLLHLDLKRTRIAIGIAASMAAGLRENFGTMTKGLHVGRAAQGGVEAADLAGRGWTATTEALEAPRGFFKAFGGGFDGTLVHGRLGNPWYYRDPGVSIKPHPGASLSHPAMWEMLRLALDHDLQPDQVDSVSVGTSSNVPNALIHHLPRDPYAAKFSMEYAVATILVRRRCGLRDYTPEAVLEPAVQDLLPKVSLVTDPVAEAAGFHRMLSRVTVRLRDGRVLFAEGDAGRGHPANPMDDEEVATKFVDCARWADVEDGGTRIASLVTRLEELTVEEVRELCQALP